MVWFYLTIKVPGISVKVNSIVKKWIKWISKSTCVPCLTEEPDTTSTSKRHPLCFHLLDRYLYSDSTAVIYTAHQRDRIKSRHIKKLPRVFFPLPSFHFCLFNLALLTPTPNHQPSRLACHCWVSSSPSEGPLDFFSLSLSLFYSGRISHFIGVWGSHQLANFIVQMGLGTGQLPGLCRKDRLWPGFALWSAVPHPTTTKLLACSYLQLSHLPTLHPQDLRRFGGQQPICEDTWLFTGGEISFTRAPVIWTVSNEANLVTSTDEQPRVWFGIHSSTANETTGGCDYPTPVVANFFWGVTFRV